VRIKTLACSLALAALGILCSPACQLSQLSESSGGGEADSYAKQPAAEEKSPEALAAAEAKRVAARARGKELFRYACATCHGLRGDGKGPSALALDPRPRDFTRGLFKWRSTESGSLPLDSDIFRTISRGVPGTRMPAWKDLLSEDQRWDLVEQVKTFSRRFAEEGVQKDEIVQVPEPVPATSETVSRGKELFEANKCWECHGREGRADGPSAKTLKDSWAIAIRPFDFTTGRYRCGGTDRDIYRTFFTGLNGTPMPSYALTIPEADRWPLVHYVRSLQRRPGLLEQFLFEVP
jgi:cytochrome c oxidase cbb3-type subunit 2